MAITATFNASTGVLSVFGDNLDNNAVVSRNAAGSLLVNGGAIAIQGGTATVSNTTLIQVFGQGGNDVLTLSEINGALPAANLFGGAGNDTLTGGSGADQLFGQADNDTLLGKGGNDFLFGGDGNDTLTGGDGDDQMFGEAGDDRLIWNPGDDSDLFEGGDGTDTAEVNGGNGAETFSLTANGTRVRFDRLDPAPFSLDIGTTEQIVVNMNGGDDTFTAGNGLAALIGVTVDGGTGNDTITGGDGADRLLGGDGNDVIAGGRGNDTALLGTGDDTFTWNPGDGSDTVEGQAGTDTLLFNGANIAETINISANGGRVLFTRDVANIVMDLNDVEHIAFKALGGADRITVNDLSGTDVTQVSIDLSSGGVGDGAADTVTVTGTAGNDAITVTGSGQTVSVTGLPASVTITGAEGANDRLTINGGGGADTITATTLPAGVIGLTIDAGAGNDTVNGSQGADVILGGDGNDFVFGDNGDDVAFLGTGDDTFDWDPGDGSDVVEGQDGTDTLDFSGANVAENIDISANGSRARFFRDVGNVTMDLNGVEIIDFKALGGADNIVVGDLTGTDVTEVKIDLSGPTSGGDGAADTVTVNGTNGTDAISIADASGIVSVTGLHASVRIEQAEAGLDRLVVNGLGGDDVIDASGLHAGTIALTVNGGDGADLITGSGGADTVFGGRGDDVALLGAGDDSFVWNPGDGSDTVEGQAGTDTLAFNGANIAENIAISANGARAQFTRDVANITMDLNGVEHIAFKALGGADHITVNDLSGTDVSSVAIDLGNGAGGGDGAADIVDVRGSAGNDTIRVATDASQTVTVSTPHTTVAINGAEVANDRLVVFGGFGNDVIDARGTHPLGLILNGEAGNDTLVSSAGGDLLDGGLDSDTASFAGSSSGVSVNLTAGTATGGDAQNDILISIENLTGSAFSDALTGDGGANVLDGGGGADSLSGLGGDDSYFVDNSGDLVFEAAGGGADTVFARASYALQAGQSIEVLRVSSVASTLAIDLTGNELDQTLVGNSGANRLDGGGGADTMRGGLGNDSYFVDNAGDLVFETGNGGNDTVFARTSYALQAGQSVEILRASSVNGTSAMDLTGNELAQSLHGNNGVNRLDGGGGADAMWGYGGDDAYFVDNAGDRVFEAAGEGADTVFARTSYALQAGQSIEVLRVSSVAGTSAINLTGNEFSQTLVGNSGANVLDGGGGADTMRGGLGDDSYFVDNSGDLVFETGNGGNDTVFARTSYALQAGQSVEILRASSVNGTSAMDLTGNELAQSLHGNNGANHLDGGAGADAMWGYGGNDAYFVDNAGDRVFEAAGQGSDTVFARASYALQAGQSVEFLRASSVNSTTAMNLTGNEFAQSVHGNAGDNILDGKGGSDLLQGYGGSDTFVFSTALGSNNIDHIVDFSTTFDTIRLDRTVFSALGLGTLDADAFKDIGVAGAVVDANDRILYNHNTGELFYDSNGSAAGGRVEFAILDNKPANLSHTDFFVVA